MPVGRSPAVDLEYPVPPVWRVWVHRSLLWSDRSGGQRRRQLTR